MQLTSVLGRVIATAGLVTGMAAAGEAAASASPSNAPTSTSGHFTCPGNVTGTFVVNSGKSSAPTTTWTSAHLTFADGSTGIFVPTALDLMVMSPQGPVAEDFTKGNAPGSVTCSITAPLQPPFFLTGTVTGNIIRN
jgi:hypothetical protein